MKKILNFYGIRKNIYTNKHLSTLGVNGKFIKDLINIAKAQTDFYQNLYSEKFNQQNDNYHNSLNEFLNNNEIPKLNNNEKPFMINQIVRLTY